MTVVLLLKNYDVNVLVALGNQAIDMFTYNKIKMLIVDNLLESGYPMYLLIEGFKRSKKILKEAYAESITILMKDCDYEIESILVSEIINFISLDALMYYGAESKSCQFASRCIEEFWNRALEIEDKTELNNKRTAGKIKFMVRSRRKKKGDIYGKY